MTINKINIGNQVEETFFLMPAEIVAGALIGKVLLHKTEKGIIAAEIVETEAYLHGIDAASHSYPGLTKRNSPMFERGGCIYVYKIYGVHLCFNIVTEDEGIASAVLIRAARPVAGLDLMAINRGNKKPNELCKGPGNLTKAFGFSLSDNSKRLNESDIQLYEGFDRSGSIGMSRRIGITKSEELELRYFVNNSDHISGRKSLNISTI